MNALVLLAWPGTLAAALLAAATPVAAQYKAPPPPPVTRPSAATPNMVRVLQGHNDWITSLAFSPDGQRAVSASKDKTLRLWDLKSGQVVQKFIGHQYGVLAAAWTPDGRGVLSGTGGILALGGQFRSLDCTARLWDVASAGQLAQYDGGSYAIHSIAPLPDGQRALVGGGAVEIRRSGARVPTDSSVRIWDYRQKKETARLAGHTKAVMSVAVSPDGKLGASGSLDGTVRLWDLEAGRLIRSLEAHRKEVVGVTFSRDGKRLLSAGLDGAARCWDVEGGRELSRLASNSPWVTCVAFAPDGRALAAIDRTLRVWDAEAGKELARLDGHTETITCLAVSPDGRQALSGAKDRVLILWKMP